MKPGTFTQMYVHLVFAVKYRESILTRNIRPRLFEYVSGIVTGLKHKSLIVNGFCNHIHIFIGMNPSVSISDTVHDIKRASSLFINENKLVPGRFAWQDGYGAFTCSRSHLEDVYEYIKGQEDHHSKYTFREEYINILSKHDIDYDPKYLFEFFDL